MRPVVDEERRLLLESLSAEIAYVRSLVGVYPAVLDDVAFGGEHAATQVAGEVLDALVRLLQVSDETLRYSELLATQVADEGSFTRVDPHVPNVGVWRVEALAAGLAVVVDAT